MQFWGRNKDDDTLVVQVEQGLKTATVCKADEYELSEGDYDDGGWKAGDLVEVYDLRENLRCLIEITEVYRVTWSNIPEKLWKGECNVNENEFKDDHISCWPEYSIDDHFEMVATHFKIIENY